MSVTRLELVKSAYETDAATNSAKQALVRSGEIPGLTYLVDFLACGNCGNCGNQLLVPISLEHYGVVAATTIPLSPEEIKELGDGFQRLFLPLGAHAPTSGIDLPLEH